MQSHTVPASTVYLVSDFITDHPSCINGEGYWRPHAMLPCIIAAKQIVGGGIITQHKRDIAKKMYDARRLIDEEIHGQVAA